MKITWDIIKRSHRFCAQVDSRRSLPHLLNKQLPFIIFQQFYEKLMRWNHEDKLKIFHAQTQVSKQIQTLVHKQEEGAYFSSYKFLKYLLCCITLSQSANSCHLNMGTYLRNAAIFLFNSSEAFSKFIDPAQTWKRKQKKTKQPPCTYIIFSYSQCYWPAFCLTSSNSQ